MHLYFDHNCSLIVTISANYLMGLNENRFAPISCDLMRISLVFVYGNNWLIGQIVDDCSNSRRQWVRFPFTN